MQTFSTKSSVNLSELCNILSISVATGRNWIKLGKITPKYDYSQKPFFERSYVNSIKNDLKTGTNEALKSRRNKKFVTGNNLYNSYVSIECKNLQTVQQLLKKIENQNIELTDETIGYILADCAVHFMLSRNENCKTGDSKFLDYLSGNLSLRENELIDALISDKESALSFYNLHSDLFNFDYKYEEKEDVLGLIYISCKNLGKRKATGSYYTPTKIVNRLISALSLNENSKILDPCCGTGNFLLQLPKKIPFENIYGNDTDSTSVKITRINMALRYPEISVNLITSHISEIDYLTDFSKSDFSAIIGNPPWGYDFSEEQALELKREYKSAANSSIESYDVFIEQSLKLLKENGQLSFVLPEAILNVKSHSIIRQIILNEAVIKEIKYLGNAFDGVQCPSIILRLEKNCNTHSTVGMIIEDKNRRFEVKEERKLTSDYFSFLANDNEYKILEKIKNVKERNFLSGNADFALGIVTGNNKKYIEPEKAEHNEMILKGSDILKYRAKPSSNFINFEPEKFQQVAPTKLYRAREKLLYRFISSQLVFAYDDKQTLSLNSCNILIPKIDGMNIKYIMAILNSRVAQFLFKKEFNSIKVLRAHIESIPIPVVSSEIQEEIIKSVNLLVSENASASIDLLYDKLDEKICRLFCLTSEEQDIIKNAVDCENKFLY
ncbi:MAG: N-6 DNA methylase [Treponema sp.]|nr:N-6 DNA methylase [Candidatus Treponema equifaecale]